MFDEYGNRPKYVDALKECGHNSYKDNNFFGGFTCRPILKRNCKSIGYNNKISSSTDCCINQRECTKDTIKRGFYLIRGLASIAISIFTAGAAEAFGAATSIMNIVSAVWDIYSWY